MSKYYICCQHKELNSLSHHNCYLLASVADYDGVTLMSEMMMLVMMAIIITLAITAVAMSRKTLEAFFFFFGDLYCLDTEARLFCARFSSHVEKNTCCWGRLPGVYVTSVCAEC